MSENINPSLVSEGCQTSPVRAPVISQLSSPETSQTLKPATKVISPKPPNKPLKPTKSSNTPLINQLIGYQKNNGTQSKYPPDWILLKFWMRMAWISMTSCFFTKHRQNLVEI